MSTCTSMDVRIFIEHYIARKLAANGRGPVETIPENCDLLLSGMIDSLGLLDLVAALQDFAGREIDFEILDPEEMTVVGPLCNFVSEQVSRHG
jgi:acyl carrier protein